MSIADERIDSNYRNAAVDRRLERTYELAFVGRCDENRVWFPPDDRVEYRYLLHGVELRCALENQLSPERISCCLRAFVHRDVERIGGEARDQRDGVLLLFLRFHPLADRHPQGIDREKKATRYKPPLKSSNHLPIHTF